MICSIKLLKKFVIVSGLLLASCDYQHEDIKGYYKELRDLLIEDGDREKKYDLSKYQVPQSRFFSYKKTHARSNISILEFFSLKECNLRYVVAQGNSVLGKIAAPSQKLKYQLDFIYYSNSCISILKSNNKLELSKKLTIILDEKKQHLSQYIWQAIFSGPEFKSFWQMKNHPSSFSNEKILKVKNAFENLNNFIDQIIFGVHQFDIKSFEKNLGVIRSNIGGELYQDIMGYKIYLSKLNDLLNNENLLRERFCMRSDSPEIFEKYKQIIFPMWETQHMIKSDLLKKRYFDIIKLIQKIESKISEGEPIEYREWRINRDKNFELGFMEIEKHYKYLRKVKNICS